MYKFYNTDNASIFNMFPSLNNIGNKYNLISTYDIQILNYGLTTINTYSKQAGINNLPKFLFSNTSSKILPQSYDIDSPKTIDFCTFDTLGGYPFGYSEGSSYVELLKCIGNPDCNMVKNFYPSDKINIISTESCSINSQIINNDLTKLKDYNLLPKYNKPTCPTHGRWLTCTN